jgi:hypothetical protein
MKKIENNKGFIGRIILLVLGVIALKYFLNFDLIAYFRSPEFQTMIQPLVDILTQIYNWLDMVVRAFVGK